jgi:hypothetical protein
MSLRVSKDETIAIEIEVGSTGRDEPEQSRQDKAEFLNLAARNPGNAQHKVVLGGYTVLLAQPNGMD